MTISNDSATLEAVLNGLSAAVAEESSIPIIFPGQAVPSTFNVRETHAVVFNSTTTARRASVGTPALWRVDAALTMRIYVPLHPTLSVIRARRLTGHVVTFFRTLDIDDVDVSDITTIEIPPVEGRYYIDITANYTYHDEA